MNGKWKRVFAAGLLGSAICAGAATAAEIRMKAERAVPSRAQAPRGRVVQFKTDRTDSWLCENVSPFFCSVVPTAQSTPAAATTRQRGRQ